MEVTLLTVSHYTSLTTMPEEPICLQAGMDDYISKPVRIEELMQVLEKCQMLKSLTNPAAKLEPVPDLTQSSTNLENLTPVTLNLTVLASFRRAMDDDESSEVTRELIGYYFTETLILFETMHRAIAQQNIAALQQSAHSLKSTSRTFGAAYLGQLCQELETNSLTATSQENIALLTQIESEYERVKTALQEWLSMQ